VHEAGGAFEARAVQLAIELPPGLSRRLSRWCRETAHRLDVPGIPRADVLEALLDHLVIDEGTADAVRARLAGQLCQECPPAARPLPRVKPAAT
jgi:hypothetical protein